MDHLTLTKNIMNIESIMESYRDYDSTSDVGSTFVKTVQIRETGGGN